MSSILALAALPATAWAQSSTTAAGDVVPGEPAATPPATADPAATDPAAPTEDERGAEHVVRVSAYAGVGATRHDVIGGDAHAAIVGGGIDFVGVRGLRIGASLEGQLYRRRYLTSLPSSTGNGLGSVDVDESRLRLGLAVGVDLARLLERGHPIYGIEPALLGGMEWFQNSVLPLMVGRIGGGLTLWVDPASELRLLAAISYESVPDPGDVTIVRRDVFGGLYSELRWSGAAQLVLAPRATLGVRYLGEWLAYGHASRFLQAFLVDLSVEI